MMDKASQNRRDNIKDALLQRDQDRKAKLKVLREENIISGPDQTKFHTLFDEYTEKIYNCIKLVEEEKIEKKDLPEHFIKINKQFQDLNRHLTASTPFLKNYPIRKSLQTINEIEIKIRQLETECLPKKRFGFKTRNSKMIGNSNNKIDEVDADINKINLFTISCGFSDKKNENLKLDSDSILNNDVELRSLENCTVFLCGNPSTVHISNIAECKIYTGPVSTSVFVENCQNCDFVIACQQLRIHSTKDCRFYIHVVSKAIIEDSSHVQFAPYNLEYEGIEEHFKAAKLDRHKNNWNQVDDFNWLASDVVSPNWKEINENERVKSWQLQFQ